MNKWQMEGNEAPRQWQGRFEDRNRVAHYSIHPSKAKAIRSAAIMERNAE